MENKSFNYTYSADRQEEVKRIRDKYIPREEDKMEKLRKLDQGASQKAMAISLSVGIIGSLVFGTGMSCTMVWTDRMLIPGIIIGIAGIIGVGLAYPLYTKTLKKERDKIAPEIIRLTDELMK